MSEEMCPFVGLENDRLTAVGFPSPRNMCHRAATPQSVDIVHQGKYCMMADHVSCPFFLQQASSPSLSPAPVIVPGSRTAAPQDTRPVAKIQNQQMISVQKPKRRARAILLPLMAVAGILAIFLAVILILPSSGQFQDGLIGSATIIGNNLTQTSTVRPIGVVPLNNEATKTAVIATPTAPSTATKAPTSTRVKATTTATRVNSPLPLATQCGRPAGWVQYSVRSGDSLSSLSRIFNLSISQLQIANCMGNSTFLYVGQLIYTPWIPPVPVPPTAVPPTLIPSETAVPPTVAPSETSAPPTVAPSETTVPTTAVPPTEIPTVGATVPEETSPSP